MIDSESEGFDVLVLDPDDQTDTISEVLSFSVLGWIKHYLCL